MKTRPPVNPIATTTNLVQKGQANSPLLISVVVLNTHTRVNSREAKIKIINFVSPGLQPPDRQNLFSSFLLKNKIEMGVSTNPPPPLCSLKCP